MIRQQKLIEIGQMNFQDQMSYFIIPVPHHFYKNNNNILLQIESNTNWKIINKDTERQFGAFNIKNYIYDNMIPPLDINNHTHFIEDHNTLLLRYNSEISCKIEEFKFDIYEIDLWIFDAHVAFFTLKVDLHNKEKYNIDQIIGFNSLFRNYKFLNLKQLDTNQLEFSKNNSYIESKDMVNFLFEKTQINKVNFLNIDIDECVSCTKNGKVNKQYSIYNSSTNAKLMTAVHTVNTKFSNGEDIEPLHDGELHFNTINGVSIFEELPYYLASCTPMDTPRNFMANEEYILSLVDTGGLNIWKYSTGTIMNDSFAMVGLANDGGPVCRNMNNHFYFIYILNLYVNYQTKYIETTLINKDFESLSISELYRKLQKLKNQFLADEIGIKFQENELQGSMLGALKTKDLIEEVTNNLLETKDITQSNIGLYITLIGFILATVFEEQLQNFVINYYQVIIIILAGVFIFRKKLRNIKSLILDKLGL